MNVCKTHKAGDIIEFAGSKFVVLDDLGPLSEESEGHDLFILSLESQGESRFGCSNNYAESELRRRTAVWLDDLLAHGIVPYLIRSRTLDLTTLDGRGKYGELTVKAAPLTIYEARRYADIIPNYNSARWLATGWDGADYGAESVLYVSTNGFWSVNDCSRSYDIRPALVISSLLLSSVDESGLRNVPTDELLEELRRRTEGR